MLFMDNQVNRFILLTVFISHSFMLSAQEYHGTTGLLHVPSGEMGEAGHFRGGASFLHRAVMPDLSYHYGDGKPFNTMSFTLGISAFSWLELSYTSILLKIHKNGNPQLPMGYYNEDRHVNVKVRLIKEKQWWPAVAVGWDDIARIPGMEKDLASNNFFRNTYVAASKHYVYQGHIIGAHLAYRYYPSKENRDHHGIVGGVTVEPLLKEFWDGMPTWVQRPRVIAEWDGAGVNVGADVLLWRHLFIQASIVHGHGFTGGLSYHYTIPF